MYDRFEALDTTVVAVSQEDETLENHAKMEGTVGPDLRFDLLADLGREHTQAYDRTTAYLIDREGVVRQIFPMTLRMRPSWEIVLGEVERLEADR